MINLLPMAALGRFGPQARKLLDLNDKARRSVEPLASELEASVTARHTSMLVSTVCRVEWP